MCIGFGCSPSMEGIEGLCGGCPFAGIITWDLREAAVTEGSMHRGQRVTPCQPMTSLFISWPPSSLICNRQPTTQDRWRALLFPQGLSPSLEALTQATQLPPFAAFLAPLQEGHLWCPQAQQPFAFIFLESFGSRSRPLKNFFGTGSHL